MFDVTPCDDDMYCTGSMARVEGTYTGLVPDVIKVLAAFSATWWEEYVGAGGGRVSVF